MKEGSHTDAVLGLAWNGEFRYVTTSHFFSLVLMSFLFFQLSIPNDDGTSSAG